VGGGAGGILVVPRPSADAGVALGVGVGIRSGNKEKDVR
jgi:hypothetical protein